MLKKLTSVLLIVVMMISTGVISNAEGVEFNTCKKLTTEQMEIVSNNIKNYLLDKYEGIYKFDNFYIEFFNEEIQNNKICIDVDANVDMTLIQSPKNSPYVLGMEKALLKLNDDAEKFIARKEIDSYLHEVEQYYNKTYRSTFPYRIELEIPKITKIKSNNELQYDFLHRMDITEEEILTSPVLFSEKKDKNKLIISGENAIDKIVKQKSNMIFKSDDVKYDRLKARDYARKHAKDEPEFNKENDTGSDCANFVSKALNAGGIPEDKDGKWYESTKYGDPNRAGINWIRTGYNNNGGVVPYMTDKGYFYKQTDESKVFAGSIMYWKNSSHVALTTYGDGQIIKYSQHSNVPKSKKEYTYDSSEISVKFYMPSSSIMEDE